MYYHPFFAILPTFVTSLSLRLSESRVMSCLNSAEREQTQGVRMPLMWQSGKVAKWRNGKLFTMDDLRALKRGYCGESALRNIITRWCPRTSWFAASSLIQRQEHWKRLKHSSPSNIYTIELNHTNGLWKMEI